MVWNGRIDDSDVNVFDPQFKLSSIDQSSDKERGMDGEFRILSATMKLRRNPFKYFKVIMLPGMVFTIIAYLTLFISEAPSAEETPNRVPFQFGIIRTSLTAAASFVYQLISQLYYAGAAGEAVLTGADVWIWSSSVIQFSILLFNSALLIASRRPCCQTTTVRKCFSSELNLNTFGSNNF